ncbi:MAG: hypothetical protein GF405_02090 [Candidatus Eisenbacteria bacterium]|nr:hypothetical protein [Candidatus Eisenbacteria bacterium]
MVSARESRHPRWPVPAHALCALAGLLALVLAAGSPVPAAAQDARPDASDHVLVGMAPNIGYEVTCDDSLLSLEPVHANGLGIMEFLVDPRATGSPTKICVRVPAPPVIFGESTGALTDTSAVLTWQTDRPARSRVEYGTTTSYGATTPTAEKLGVFHSFTLEDLEPATLYHYRLHSTDAFGNETVSDDMTFTTLAPRPRIVGLGVEAVTDSTITLSWTTNLLCEVRVEYGLQSSHEHSTPLVPGFAVKHEVTVEELAPDTPYLLAAVAIDTLGREVRSGDLLENTAIPPLSILSPAVVDTTMTTAVVGCRTSNPAQAVVDYGPTEQYGWTVDTGGQNTTEHLAVLEELTAGATYHYRVRAQDEYGQSVETPDAVFSTKPEGTPENLTIHKLAVAPLDVGSVALSWVTNLPATTSVSWGLTDQYTDTLVDSQLVTKHAVILEDLEPAVDYHASVSSVTEGGAEATSGDFLFTSPPPDLTIEDAEIHATGGASIAVSWSTSVPADGWLEYGPTPACELTTEPSDVPATDHLVAAEGLESMTIYYLRAASSVGSYVVRSEILTATTGPPDLEIGAPALTETTATTVTVEWTTSCPAFSYLRYGETTSYGWATGTNAIPSTGHTAVITGLSPTTTYHLEAVATDTLGRTAFSGDVSFTTPSFGPLGFREVSVFDVGPTFVSVSWQTTHRAGGVVRYGTTSSPSDSLVVDEHETDHTVVLTGLDDGTAYYVSVRAYDEDGGTALSELVSFETNEYQDLSPPHAPEQLAVASEGDAVLVTWDANPEHDLAGYRVYRRAETDTAAAVVDVAPSYRTEYRDTDIVPGVIYEYAVSAHDGSGNVSERSGWVAVAAGSGRGGRVWAWPNPLRDATRIRLALPARAIERGSSRYAVKVYDAAGRLVRTLASGVTAEATVTTSWDGRDERNHPVSSGVYFCVAEFEGGGARGKLLVLR